MDLIWQINNYITLLFSNFVINNNLERIIGYFSDAPIFFLPIFFLSTWGYYTFKKPNISEKKNILLILYSVILAMIGNQILKFLIVEERPDSIIKPILSHVPDNSFPSDHATVSFAFLFGIYAAGYKKTFWIFMPFVVLMNISRIAGGLHWFFDIFIGLLLGFFSVIFIFKNSKNKIIQKIHNFFLKIAGFLKL